MSFWSDVVHAVSTYYTDAWAAATGGAVSNASGAVGTAAGAVSSAAGGVAGFAGFATVIEGIWTELTNGKMWRSLGWLLLGIVLMLLAVGWWIGPSAARRSPLGVAAEGLG